MAEIKTYGFLIGLNECIEKRNKLIVDMKKAKGFLGVTPEPRGYGQILLFKTRAERNEAMKQFKREYNTVQKVPVEILVDSAYIDGTKKATPADYGDDKFAEMIHDLEAHALEEARKEYEENERVFNNRLGEYKTKIAEMEKKISMLEYQLKASHDKVLDVMNSKNEKIKALNKEIKELEAKIKMLQIALTKGE